VAARRNGVLQGLPSSASAYICACEFEGSASVPGAATGNGHQGQTLFRLEISHFNSLGCGRQSFKNSTRNIYKYEKILTCAISK
jgi:hypothetical protein